MKYINNKTDNNLLIKTVADGKQKSLYFPKNTTIAVQDSYEALFLDNEAYVKMFTDGMVAYTTKPSEVYEDNFTDYLKSYYYNTTEGFILIVDEALIGETVSVAYSVDGEAVSVVTAVIGDERKVEISMNPTTSIEFKLSNDYYLDFPIAYSPRIKFYL